MTVVCDKDGRLELRTFSTTERGDTITAYEGADPFLDRHTVIDAMELVELDPLESQPPQTVRTSAAEMFRPAIDVPIAGTRTRQPALARYHELGRIRVEGLSD